MRQFTTIVVLLILGVRCAGNHGALNAQIAVRTAGDRLTQGLSNADTAELRAALADSATLSINGVHADGIDAIMKKFQTDAKYIKYAVVFDHDDTRFAPQLAISRGAISGAVTLNAGGAMVPIQGRFLHVLRLRNGVWQFQHLIWTVAQQSGSCPSGKSCCCESISGNDCILTPPLGCGSDRPIPILMP